MNNEYIGAYGKTIIDKISILLNNATDNLNGEEFEKVLEIIKKIIEEYEEE